MLLDRAHDQYDLALEVCFSLQLMFLLETRIEDTGATEKCCHGAFH